MSKQNDLFLPEILEQKEVVLMVIFASDKDFHANRLFLPRQKS